MRRVKCALFQLIANLLIDCTVEVELISEAIDLRLAATGQTAVCAQGVEYSIFVDADSFDCVYLTRNVFIFVDGFAGFVTAFWVFSVFLLVVFHFAVYLVVVFFLLLALILLTIFPIEVDRVLSVDYQLYPVADFVLISWDWSVLL